MMKCLFALLAAWCLPAACFAAAPSAACVRNANASLAAMVGGDFPTAAKDFSTTTAAALPAAKLGETWAALEGQVGKFVGNATARTQQFEGRAVVVVPVDFAQGKLDFVVSCDAENRIEMFSFLRPYVVAKPAPIRAHVDAGGVRVEPLSVPSRYGPLRGALTLPAGRGPFPGVVLVGGSGPNDLDEAVGGAKPFRDLADGLARLGIASLRYDKRQVDYPLQMSANPNLTVDEEETDDALSAARLLAEQKGVIPRRVFVLGHSEGGMLAPRIAERDPALAGIILLAAPARSILTVMQEQIREQGARQGLPKARIAASEKALADEQALLAGANPKQPPAGSFGGAPQSWWLSLQDYDQVATAKKLSLPMLILQGGSDFQVSPALDFDAWKRALAGKSNVTFHLFPGLSHLFTAAGKTLTPADYAQPAHVAPAVIQTIAQWILAQPAARAAPVR